MHPCKSYRANVQKGALDVYATDITNANKDEVLPTLKIGTMVKLNQKLYRLVAIEAAGGTRRRYCFEGINPKYIALVSK
jgi:hypothetical protein